MVILAYEDNAPYWLEHLIEVLYPRFIVEKQRFELSFFLYKADQILIRTLLVTAGLTISCYCISPISLIRYQIQSFPIKQYNILIFIFYAGLLYFSWRWVFAFDEIVKLAPFYKGILIYRLLHLPVLPLGLFYTLYTFYIISILNILRGSRKVIWPASVALILVLFQGYINSFEKVEHGQVTLTYAVMLMPFMFLEINDQIRYRTQQNDKVQSWTLFLIQFTIAAVYFLSGLEKMLTSGLAWASSDTFRTYITLHDQPLGIELARNDVIASILPLGALFFQLTFFIILIKPRWKYIYLPMGIFFHLGTKILMDIGPYFSSWIFVYIFFIDWKRLWNKVLSAIDKRHINNQKGA
ncbi:HTTM domain-containing protein [Catalinimonas alkaloidigena]|uniref:HTTM domain-containing protein n=1 Tax=Catalinimonas alkaloidigena TaxID=1075417 RepID=UPI0024057267|nr:HTTM domain-containing protein [Catalinimonas alkaloidigena]